MFPGLRKGNISFLFTPKNAKQRGQAVALDEVALAVVRGFNDIMDCITVGRKAAEYVISDKNPQSPEVVILGVRNTSKEGGEQDFSLIFPYSRRLVDILQEMPTRRTLTDFERNALGGIITRYGGIPFDATCWYKIIRPGHNITFIEPGIFTNSDRAVDLHEVVRESHAAREIVRSSNVLTTLLYSGTSLLAYTKHFKPYAQYRARHGEAGCVTAYLHFDNMDFHVDNSFENKDVSNYEGDYGYGFGITFSVTYAKHTKSDKRYNETTLYFIVNSQKQLAEIAGKSGRLTKNTLDTLIRRKIVYIGTVTEDLQTVIKSKSMMSGYFSQTPELGIVVDTFYENIDALLIFLRDLPSPFKLIRRDESQVIY
ncbi:MAG: hypothetical protein V1859_02610 [archaeon]